MASDFYDLRPEQVPNAVTQSFPNVHFLAKSSTVLPHEPFTVKIRAILVQTKRSPKNSFGAALHTTPFDRVNGDI
jgi:hypothetical protein